MHYLQPTPIQARLPNRRLLPLALIGAAALVAAFIAAWVIGAQDVLDSSGYLTRVDLHDGLPMPFTIDVISPRILGP
jgi:hypothetical protein